MALCSRATAVSKSATPLRGSSEHTVPITTVSADTPSRARQAAGSGRGWVGSMPLGTTRMRAGSPCARRLSAMPCDTAMMRAAWLAAATARGDSAGIAAAVLNHRHAGQLGGQIAFQIGLRLIVHIQRLIAALAQPRDQLLGVGAHPPGQFDLLDGGGAPAGQGSARRASSLPSLAHSGCRRCG